MNSEADHLEMPTDLESEIAEKHDVIEEAPVPSMFEEEEISKQHDEELPASIVDEDPRPVILDSDVQRMLDHEARVGCVTDDDFGYLDDTLDDNTTILSCAEMGAVVVDSMRDRAWKCHAKAYPLLQERLRQLGVADNACLDRTLEWIRDSAPIIVHFRPGDILPRLEVDTQLRNRFVMIVYGRLPHK